MTRRLQLTASSLPSPLPLGPCGETEKAQWDHVARRPRPATLEELSTYCGLESKYRDFAARKRALRLADPIEKDDGHWVLYFPILDICRSTDLPER